MRYLLFIFVLIFSACSTKNFEHTSSKIIIIKSPKIKFSDLGYIRHTNKEIELELFVAGHAVENISINHLICVTKGCMSKSGFNEEYLSKHYPDDILQNILLAQPIFKGKNLQKKENGFIQKISSNDIDIKYSVQPNVTFFKDRKNRIIFKIKTMK